MNDPVPIARYPMRREDPLQPPFAYARLRERGPVALAELGGRPGANVWLITRYNEAKQVLADTRFSSDFRRPGFPVKRSPGGLIRMDPPEHTRYRRMLNAEFSERRMAELQPIVQQLTDDLLDKIAAALGPVDLVPTLAVPLPSLVICKILGVPYEDREFLQERTALALSVQASQSEVNQAKNELGRYMDELLRYKRSDRGEDLLTRLVSNHVEPGACSMETAADLARLLFVSGHFTTVSMIGIGILTLLQYSEQWRRLRQQPDMIGPAVEELIRYHAIAATVVRVATDDIEVGGAIIRSGEGVMVLLSSANRDRLAFERPDTFDINRSDGRHIAFGWGPHMCIGAALARLELRTVYASVIRRFPGLKLAVELKDIPFKEKGLIYGVHALPVVW